MVHSQMMTTEQMTTALRLHFSGGRSNPKIKPKIRRKIFERDGHQCVDCGNLENLTIDHVIPWSKGGDNKQENLQTLCSVCNQKKADKWG